MFLWYSKISNLELFLKKRVFVSFWRRAARLLHHARDGDSLFSLSTSMARLPRSQRFVCFGGIRACADNFSSHLIWSIVFSYMFGNIGLLLYWYYSLVIDKLNISGNSVLFIQYITWGFVDNFEFSYIKIFKN